MLLDQHCPTELSAMMDMFLSVMPNTLAISHTWLLGTWNVVSETKEWNFQFYCLADLNLMWNSRTWLVATVLHSTVLGKGTAWRKPLHQRSREYSHWKEAPSPLEETPHIERSFHTQVTLRTGQGEENEGTDGFSEWQLLFSFLQSCLWLLRTKV